MQSHTKLKSKLVTELALWWCTLRNCPAVDVIGV